jgi:hypothetical protein
MLSSLAYNKTGERLRAACFRRAVEVIPANPAYTSVMGAVNHAQQAGISVHQGAAMAIARRGLGLSERPTVRKGVAPARKGGHVTFDLPVRNRSKHVGSFWSNIRTRLTAAHVAHVRSGGSREPPAPLPLKTPVLSATWTLPASFRHANRPELCSLDVIGISKDVPSRRMKHLPIALGTVYRSYPAGG